MPEFTLRRFCVQITNYEKLLPITTCLIVIVITTQICMFMSYQLYYTPQSQIKPVEYFSLPYSSFNSYPLSINLRHLVDKIKKGDVVDVEPIFNYQMNITKSPKQSRCSLGINTPNKRKWRNTAQCRLESLHPIIIFIVKSKIDNFAQRQMIRETWGNGSHMLPKYYYRTVFVVGNGRDDLIRGFLDKEFERYNDIVQVDYVESYFGNTYKTLNAIHWVVENHSNVKHVAFVDDDFYVNPKLLMELIKENSDVETLYMGNIGSSRPDRRKGYKWYISRNEFPYDTFPPFVTGGFVLFTLETLQYFHIAANYVLFFRFDDVYLGILSEKLAIEPIPISNIRNICENNVMEFYVFGQLLASHCYSNPDDLQSQWRRYLHVFQ